MGRLKMLVKKMIQGDKATTETYLAHLKEIGVKIGNDVIIYSPINTLIDEQYPWLLTIGDHVRITEGVKILTHDYSWSVLKTCSGGILGASGTVKIGNNVFIGMNSIISRNVEIGDNVIIGAGSVVTKNCEENSVYAGVPAKRIMSIDEFWTKRLENYAKEAKQLAVRYYERFGRKPDKEVFHEYFMLFETAESVAENTIFDNKLDLCGNREISLAYMKDHSARFENFDEFLRYCFDE